MKIIAGSSNLPLAEKIAKLLDCVLIPRSIQNFPDREIFVELLESVRGEEIFILQSTSNPTNDHLMELLILTDALKRALARRIIAVIPYFGYSRQDRNPSLKSSISAKLVADLIVKSGIDQIVTLDLHSPQLQGFFECPLEDLSANSIFADDIKNICFKDNTIIVSPDIGGIKRAQKLAEALNCNMVFIDKRRPCAGSISQMSLIGCVKNHHVILIDDIVDTAGTLCLAAQTLKEAGALSIKAYVTHGVLSSSAFESINASALQEIILTDSIHHADLIKKCQKIRLLSISTLLAQAIHHNSQ